MHCPCLHKKKLFTLIPIGHTHGTSRDCILSWGCTSCHCDHPGVSSSISTMKMFRTPLMGEAPTARSSSEEESSGRPSSTAGFARTVLRCTRHMSRNVSVSSLPPSCSSSASKKGGDHCAHSLGRTFQYVFVSPFSAEWFVEPFPVGRRVPTRARGR